MLRFALLALAFLFGCDTFGSAGVPDRNGVDVSALSHDTDALVGTWDLVTITPSGECIGADCTRTRPASEFGQSARLTFRADGTSTYIYNEEVLAEGSYSTFAREPDDIPVLQFGAGLRTFGIDGDRLYLDDRIVDGPLLEFERQ